ncbi:hypothetical protein E1A91_A03G023800v1 [Gossypium mustelinum]|uniref:Rapid ALkalinization Factor n=3 Tax=Gossypium TaxID=3633 RepID=A0A2P5Y0I6_GOSBA|nr:hypothetical protein ES319_A03G020000v1 [Gossypium barbadense]PPS09107.1 hypothetical protein GOBAR_AA11543 [Gossypium barbadense]TYH23556.1 hypothetical protein ES288_A03G023000v1 [Gossypium darwinii]TYJ41475.1 hypothetical protein E1A91_A03G023800v1 [Gossypium mustelinum]
MGLSNMKIWLICLVLISMVVVQVDATTRSGVKYIDPGVLNPCKRPGGPHPGCHPNPKSTPTQANTYDRGCSRHHRCRHR